MPCLWNGEIGMWKGAAALCVTLAMAACGRSPLAPSSTAEHVEPPGVLGGPGPGSGQAATTDHVEPPGVLRTTPCADDGNEDGDEPDDEGDGGQDDGNGDDPEPLPPCKPDDGQ